MSTPEASQDTFSTALLAWHRNLPEEAARHLQPLLAEKPRHLNGLHLMARCQDALCHDALAEDYFRQAISWSPLNHPLWEDYADFLIARGRHAEAERALLRALINNPAAAQAYTKLARNCCYLQEWQTAHEIVHRLKQSSKDDPMLEADDNYVSYLFSGHQGFVANFKDQQVFMRIGCYDYDAESAAVRCLFNNSHLSAQLHTRVRVNDVCVEVGAGVGFHTVIMSSCCGAACVIPIDARPKAKDALGYAAEKNAGLIDLSHIDHIIADGTEHVLLYPDAPLNFQPRRDPDANRQTTALDSLELPRVNVLLNHNMHLNAAFLRGAEETIRRHRPLCILRMKALDLNATHTRMQEWGYALASGQYCTDETSLYCVYENR